MSRAGHLTEIANERAARKAWLSERQDRHHLDTDRRWSHMRAIDAEHPWRRTGGKALGEYGDQLRPLPHRVFARRRGQYEAAKAAGIAIPEIADRPDNQLATATYDVLAVGEGVVSVKPGDAVIASAFIGRDLGDVVADDIVELWADVESVQPGESAIVRRTGGDILGVWEA